MSVSTQETSEIHPLAMVIVGDISNIPTPPPVIASHLLEGYLFLEETQQINVDSETISQPNSDNHEL